MIIFLFTRRTTDLIPDKKWSSPQKYLQHQNQKATPSALLSKTTRQPAKATTTAFSNLFFKGFLYEIFLWVCIDNMYAYIYHLRCWGNSIRTSAAPYNSLPNWHFSVSNYPKVSVMHIESFTSARQRSPWVWQRERMMWLGVCELEK